MPVREKPRLDPGDTLPVLRVLEAPDGRARTYPDASRDALILLLLPATGPAWADYLTALDRAADDIQYWYARVLVVVRGGLEAARQLQREVAPRLTAGVNADAAVHAQLGIPATHAALLVVDRYGQVYHVAVAQRAEALPAVAELEEWAKFLATQCPECGVIDEPGYGEWSAA